MNGFYSSGGGASPFRDNEKKIGEIWEKFKGVLGWGASADDTDTSDPKLIKIDGTLALCEELGIDPSADVVLFCLAADLGSKAVGEFEKEAFVQGWMNIDSR